MSTNEKKANTSVKELSDSNFEADVLKSKLPVVVDFWAPWCGPCKMFAPTFEKVSAKFADKVVFAKINVDDHEQAPAQYGVRGIPTLLLFKDGKVAATKVGALSEGQLVEFLNGHLK